MNKKTNEAEEEMRLALGKVVLNIMVKESLMEKMTFEQRLGGEGGKRIGVTNKKAAEMEEQVVHGKEFRPCWSPEETT